MRIFAPEWDIRQAASRLNVKHLNECRHACYDAILQIANNWSPDFGERFVYNSPAVRTWKPYFRQLLSYFFALADEFKRRTGKDDPLHLRVSFCTGPFPVNFGAALYDGVIENHRSVLFQEDPGHYGQFGWKVDTSGEKTFLWPA